MENNRLKRFEGFFGEYFIQKFAETQIVFLSALQLDLEIARSLTLSGVGKICFLLQNSKEFEGHIRYFRAKEEGESIEMGG